MLLLLCGAAGYIAHAAFVSFAVNSAGGLVCPDSVPAFAASAGYNTCTFASTFPNLNRIDTANAATSTATTDWWPANSYRPDITGAFTNPGGNLSINVGSGLTFANNNPNLSTIYYPAYQISQATWAANVATIKIGYTLTAISCVANVVTATTDATHAYVALNWVTITGNTPAGYNGLVRVTGTPAGNQFTYAVTSCPGANTVLGIVDPHTYQTGDTLRMRGTTPAVYNVSPTPAITRVDANHFTFPLVISDPGPGTVLGVVIATTNLYIGRTFTNGALFRFTVAFDQTLNSAAGGSGGSAPGFPAMWLTSFANNVLTDIPGGAGRWVEIDAYECLGHNNGSCQQAFLSQDNDFTASITLSGSPTWAGGVVTVTANNHGLPSGNWISVHACSIAAYNGVVQITSAVTNSFTYALTANPGGTPTGCLVNGNGIASTGPSVPAASELCPVTVAGCSSVTGPVEDGVTFHTFDVLWVPAAKNSGTGKIWRYFDGNHLGTQDINYFTNAVATYGSGGLDSGTNWTGIWSAADTGALPAGFFLMLTAGNITGGGNWPLIVKNVQVWQGSAADMKLAAGGSGGSTYTGPGNIIAGAKMWIGLRAFSAADRGSRLVNACNSTGGGDVCVDLLSDATTGNLVSQVVNGGTCPGTNCTVKIFYDRSGLNLCGAGSACDYTQNTVASRATLVANCIGALPCARAAGAQSYTSLNFPAQAQPLTLSTVARRNPGSSAQQGLFSFSTGNFQLGWPASVNQMFMYSGNALPLATASDTNPHAVQAMFDSVGSPSIDIDGSSTAMPLSSTTGIQASPGTLLADTALSTFLTGDFYEGGMWAGAFTAGQQSSMNGNQHTYWGF